MSERLPEESNDLDKTSSAAEAAPADASATPAEASATPVDASAPPAEASAKPAEANAAPADANATPAEASATPAEANATPADANAASTDANAAPVDPDEKPSDEFEKALEEFDRSRPNAEVASAREVTPGTKVKGKVVALGDDWLTIDFGGRSEGVAKAQPFRNDDGTLRVAVGDTLEMFVVESGDQIVLATSMRAEAHEASRQLREAKASGLPVSGRVTGVNAGGLEVNLGGARGFCPMSQIESGYCEDPSVHVGHTLEFLVTSIEEGRGSAVLSRRKLLRREEEARGREMLKTLQPGQELDGTVARLEPFGAFVNLGGVDGLVHVSEIRHEHVGHPNQVLKTGEAVRVKVLRIEKDKKGRMRIALSMKACAPDPWDDVLARFSPGAKVAGTVARLTDFGAFVTLAPGIDGLVHVSQAADHRIEHVREVLKAGQTVEVHVLEVDPERRRVSLSLREPTEASKATLEIPASRGASSRGASAREGSSRGGPSRGGPSRGGSSRDRSPRGGSSRGGSPRSESPMFYESPRSPDEPTTMAIALRKAMEEAKRRKK